MAAHTHTPTHLHTHKFTPMHPRYFPEPDLPDLELSDDLMAAARAEMAELPGEKRAR